MRCGVIDMWGETFSEVEHTTTIVAEVGVFSRGVGWAHGGVFTCGVEVFSRMRDSAWYHHAYGRWCIQVWGGVYSGVG